MSHVRPQVAARLIPYGCFLWALIIQLGFGFDYLFQCRQRS